MTADAAGLFVDVLDGCVDAGDVGVADDDSATLLVEVADLDRRQRCIGCAGSADVAGEVGDLGGARVSRGRVAGAAVVSPVPPKCRPAQQSCRLLPPLSQPAPSCRRVGRCRRELLSSLPQLTATSAAARSTALSFARDLPVVGMSFLRMLPPFASRPPHGTGQFAKRTPSRSIHVTANVRSSRTLALSSTACQWIESSSPESAAVSRRARLAGSAGRRCHPASRVGPAARGRRRREASTPLSTASVAATPAASPIAQHSRDLAQRGVRLRVGRQVATSGQETVDG